MPEVVRTVRTLEAAGGGEGVVTALARLPDVVLMDIRLPDMDRIEAARRIKADPRTARIPVVALTSLAMKGDRDALLGAGFDGYLEKPINVCDCPEQVLGFAVPAITVAFGRRSTRDGLP